MKVVVDHYYCDYCGKEIGDKGHISIDIHFYAGWVKPPKWKHKIVLEDRPYQFCGDECLCNFMKTNSKKQRKSKKK